MHGIDPLEFVEEAKIEKRIALPIGKQYGIYLCFWLAIYFLEKSEFVRCNQSCALVSLILRVNLWSQTTNEMN